jgi:molecular chaperone DnaK
VFSTAVDNQPNVEIHVLQGEREFAKDNKSLGNFRLDGILPAPRGVPQIEVTFDIDANGILSVTAKDKGTGKEQSITITGASTLPSDEVERMVRESEKNAAEDKEKRDKIDLKNQSDSLCYQSEKQIQELGDKITKDDKTQIETSIKNLKEAIAGDNFEDIKKLNKKLQDELMEIGKKVYSANSTTTQKTTNEKNTNNSDSVIDADFSETK